MLDYLPAHVFVLAPAVFAIVNLLRWVSSRRHASVCASTLHHLFICHTSAPYVFGSHSETPATSYGNCLFAALPQTAFVAILLEVGGALWPMQLRMILSSCTRCLRHVRRCLYSHACTRGCGTRYNLRVRGGCPRHSQPGYTELKYYHILHGPSAHLCWKAQTCM